MAERRGTKALELWCRRMTEGYPGVKVENMTTSWRDGLAFCAMIHHFRPDLIDFASLNKNDVYRNNELAFRIAESHLGIPALLDAEDMVEYSVPDRLSILTYLSQFYQAFGGSQGGSPTRLMSKRTSTTSPDHGMVSPGSAGPPAKIAAKGGIGGGVLRREPCSRCSLPVFLAERLLVGRRLYHRTCFRCARCSHQLSLANCYETEDGQYCCETCPDEEENVQITKAHSENEVDSCLEKQKVLTRSLSDEEKQKGLLRYEDSVDVSPMSKAMSDFMNSNMLEPDLPNGRESPPLSEEPVESELSPIVEAVNACVECVDERGEGQCVNKYVELPLPNVPEDGLERPVNNEQINYKCDDKCDDSLSSGDKANAVTKETNAAANKDDLPNSRLSLVKTRMQMFEKDALSQQEQNIESRISLSSNQLDNDKLCESQIPKVPSLDKLDNTNKQTLESEQLKTEFNKTNDIDLDSVQKSDTEISFATDETKLDKSLEENENLSVKVEILLPVSKSGRNSVVENDESNVYPEELNPFGDDDDGHDIKLVEKRSTNPFGSSDEDEEEMKKPPVPSPRTKKTVEAPKVCLNPFWSDGEEPSDDEAKTTTPVPKPRMAIVSSTPAKSESSLKSSAGQPLCKIGTPYDSTVSLNSSGQRTPCGTVRKKKPAPPPPSVAKELFAADESSLHSSISSSPSHSRPHSPKISAKLRKNRPAPAPPNSTPSTTDAIVTSAELKDKLVAVSDEQITDKSFGSSEWEKAKTSKDEQNRTRQSMISSTNSTISPTSDNDMPSFPTMNKSMYGKWKRKKGPAPPRPAAPQRRQIRALPMIEDLKRELELIEVQQQGLEKQGVKIEQLIREKCEGPNSSDDASMTPEVEDLVLQLFELVNEKNELFRKQAELMYLRRQQRLEEEHADLEYQIRCLMAQPEKNKTDSDKAREEELISRLVEVVERRNEIVECLEMDRLREAEEDLSISSHLTLLAAKRDEESNLQSQSPVKVSKKEKRKIKKEKRARAKGNNMDADKDVDESESTISVSPIKDKKKKKWFLKI